MQAYEQLMQQGEQFADHDRLGEAIQAFGLAAKEAPERKEPLTKLGLLSKQMGDADAAVGFLTRAAELDPKDAFVRLNLGLIYNEAADYEAAAEQLKNAILLIVHGVVSARLEVLISGEPHEAVLAQCDELEETAAQAQELLAQVAAELQAASQAEVVA